MNNFQIDVSKTQPFKCACGNESFSQVFFLRIVPALLSPSMKAEIIPLPGFECKKCKRMADLSQGANQKPQKTG